MIGCRITVVRNLRVWGADKGQRHDHWDRVNDKGSPSQHETVIGLWPKGHHPSGEVGKGTPKVMEIGEGVPDHYMSR